MQSYLYIPPKDKWFKSVDNFDPRKGGTIVSKVGERTSFEFPPDFIETQNYPRDSRYFLVMEALEDEQNPRIAGNCQISVLLSIRVIRVSNMRETALSGLYIKGDEYEEIITDFQKPVKVTACHCLKGGLSRFANIYKRPCKNEMFTKCDKPVALYKSNEKKQASFNINSSGDYVCLYLYEPIENIKRDVWSPEGLASISAVAILGYIYNVLY